MVEAQERNWRLNGQVANPRGKGLAPFLSALAWAKPTAVGWFRKQAPPPSRGQAHASASLLSHPHFEAALGRVSTLLVSH